MKASRIVVPMIAALIVGAVVATGATEAVTSGSNTTEATYYACLSRGRLSQVGTTPPRCWRTAVISWNSVGPQGL
jgi:hypothetical protein